LLLAQWTNPSALVSRRQQKRMVSPEPELINKGFSINIILKNISALNSSAYNMMQGSRSVYTGMARHSFFTSQMQKKETHNFMTVPLFTLFTFPSSFVT
jgi:hypothetical protein